MLQATRALATRVERAEIDFCAAAARAGEPAGAESLEVGGGRALCGAPGSPFNKVLGLGLAGEVTDFDLDAIDAFYDERRVAPQIELCPLLRQAVVLVGDVPGKPGTIRRYRRWRGPSDGHLDADHRGRS